MIKRTFQIPGASRLRDEICRRAVIAIALPALLGLMTACGSSENKKAGGGPDGQDKPKPIPVQVTTVREQPVSIPGEWVAQTDGFVNAQIQPQVSGYLIRQDYKEGSLVHKGQILFEIDPRPLQASLDQARGQLLQAKAQVAQAEAQVNQAQAQLELAEINVNRDTPLAQMRAVSRSMLDNEIKTRDADKAAVDNAKASVASAQAQVVSAQAGVETAELNLGFTKVRSLIDGIAGQASVQVGNLVSTSSVLTSVSQVNPLKVYFSISEQEYLSLSKRAKSAGQPELLNSRSAIPIHMTLANDEKYLYTGRIIFVDRSLSAQTGSLLVAASFANPGNLLRPGQFARVTADTAVIPNALLVPQKAANELQGSFQVVLVDDGNKAHVRNVTLGRQVGQDVVISQGVKAGERVVIEGNDKVKDGMEVAPQSGPIQPSQPQSGSRGAPDEAAHGKKDGRGK